MHCKYVFPYAVTFISSDWEYTLKLGDNRNINLDNCYIFYITKKANTICNVCPNLPDT